MDNPGFADLAVRDPEHPSYELALFIDSKQRVGTTGQSETKAWVTEAICQKLALKLVREKMRKG